MRESGASCDAPNAEIRAWGGCYEGLRGNGDDVDLAVADQLMQSGPDLRWRVVAFATLKDIEIHIHRRENYVGRVTPAPRQPISEGLANRTLIDPENWADYDPFLVLVEEWMREPGGFPDHPHRGIETVTLVLDGGPRHPDKTHTSTDGGRGQPASSDGSRIDPSGLK